MKHFRSGSFASTALALLVSLVAAVAAAAAKAQSAAPPDPDGPSGQSPNPGPLCVTLNTITTGEILNGHEMRFELRDGTKLLATLARDCPQLKFHGRFTYQAVGGRLCAGEGRILARSGEACMISSFSTIAELPDFQPDPPAASPSAPALDPTGNNPSDSQ